MGQRTKLLSCVPLGFSVVLILFFCMEQIGVGGNVPFYDRYVFQIAPFLGIIAFGLCPTLSRARVVMLAFLLVVSYGMLWRYAFC